MSKRATHKIQSVLTIVIVMMAMLLQFHHHDCHGNIFWHLTPHAELTIGVDGCSVDECRPDHKECNHHHNHAHHGHDACSMHIAAAAITSQDVSAPVAVELHWQPEYIPVIDMMFQPDELICTFCDWYDCSCYREPLLASFRFRGPPAFVA